MVRFTNAPPTLVLFDYHGCEPLERSQGELVHIRKTCSLALSPDADGSAADPACWIGTTTEGVRGSLNQFEVLDIRGRLPLAFDNTDSSASGTRLVSRASTTTSYQIRGRLARMTFATRRRKCSCNTIYITSRATRSCGKEKVHVCSCKSCSVHAKGGKLALYAE